jgi:hypothetical protein
MNVNQTFKKRLISISLTILLGPGVGHLYLKKFKHATALILLSLIFGLHQIWYIFKTSGLQNLSSLSNNDILNTMNNFSSAHPQTMLYFDAVFAAIWAYAVVDSWIKSKSVADTVEKKDIDDNSEDKDENKIV